MTEPWEVDPTKDDRDGAGAEGGAMGGDSAGDSTLHLHYNPQKRLTEQIPSNQLAALQLHIHHQTMAVKQWKCHT